MAAAATAVLLLTTVLGACTGGGATGTAPTTQEQGSELDAYLDEIDVSVCREEVGWYDVRADVLAEAEASIVERYRAERDAMLERVRSQRAGSR